MPARYDLIADFYDEAVGDDVGDSAATAVLAVVGDVRGARVLDLACGQGRVSRELARRGADVVGADASRALLEKARAFERSDPLRVDYLEADASTPEAFPAAEFDLVVCHFGLSDIDDLDGTLATVARTLKPNGAFVFSILHPCFAGAGDDAPSSWPPGRGYYAEGWWLADNTGFRGKVGASHRTLSTYVNALVEHGLAIERVAEPEPDGEWLQSTGSDDVGPVYLVARCRRSS